MGKKQSDTDQNHNFQNMNQTQNTALLSEHTVARRSTPRNDTHNPVYNHNTAPEGAISSSVTS